MMQKKMLMFPGQGSQYIGMGLDLYQNFQIAKEVFDEVDNALNYSLSDIIFNGNDSDLQITTRTQPAIMATSIAMYRVLQETSDICNNEGISFFAGHSLGEYSALVASDCLGVSDCAKILAKRGELMSKYASSDSGMAAVIGTEVDIIQNIINNINVDKNNILCIANNNSATQVVISGHCSAINSFIDKATAFGIKKIIKLPVQGAFHSSLMLPAQKEIEPEIIKLALKIPTVPVIANYTSLPALTIDEIKNNLINQISNQVNWTKIINYAMQNQVQQFIEIGPKNVLSNMLKRDHKDLAVNNFDKVSDIKDYRLI